MSDDSQLADPALADAESARPILDQIANKWSVIILTVLCPRPSRFNAIRRRLDGITHKALTEALRRLERNGLVARRVIATSPVAVEYSLTPLGHSLRQPFEALYAWAVEHGAEVDCAQYRYDLMRDRSDSADPSSDHSLNAEGTTPACSSQRHRPALGIIYPA